jgi:hypothetical protein
MLLPCQAASRPACFPIFILSVSMLTMFDPLILEEDNVYMYPPSPGTLNTKHLR